MANKHCKKIDWIKGANDEKGKFVFTDRAWSF